MSLKKPIHILGIHSSLNTNHISYNLCTFNKKCCIGSCIKFLKFVLIFCTQLLNNYELGWNPLLLGHISFKSEFYIMNLTISFDKVLRNFWIINSIFETIKIKLITFYIYSFYSIRMFMKHNPFSLYYSVNFEYI